MNKNSTFANKIPENSFNSFEEIFNNLEDVFDYYGFDDQEFLTTKEKISNFKFRVPLVGVFSSGKSSLINAVIDDQILPQDITPETSFPVEIKYGDSKKITAINLSDNNSLDLSKEDFFSNQWMNPSFSNSEDKEISEAEDTSKMSVAESKKSKADFYVKIDHPSENLKNLKNICLLDMPGIDSSHSDHDEVISKNIKEVAAYIIVVSADEGTIKSSLGMIIKELAANEIPCGLVITKIDKHEKTKIEQITAHLKKEFSKFSWQEPIFIATASSRKKEISFFVEGVRALDNIASYSFQRKIISPLCLRLSEIHRNISRSLEDSSLDLEDVEKKIEKLDVAATTIKNIVEPAIDNFQNFVDNNTNEFIEYVLKEVKSFEKKLIQIIVQKNKNAKEEVQDIIETAVRIGLQKATKEIIEPAYVNLCIQVGGAILSKREDIKIGDSLSFDIVYDIGSSGISLSKSALLTGIGGLLLATVFPLIGIAIGVISFATSLFLKNKENEEGDDKKNSAARAQVRQFFKDLNENLKNSIPEIIKSKTQAIKEQLEDDLSKKLKSLQNQAVNLKKHITENDLENYVSLLKGFQGKVSCALSAVRHIYAPDQAKILLTDGTHINISVKKLPLENAKEIQDISFLAPVFNKIFSLLIDSSTENSFPLLEVKFPSLVQYSSSGLFKGSIKICTQNVWFQHDFLLSEKEINIVQKNIALIIFQNNQEALKKLLTISRSFNSSVSVGSEMAISEEKTLHSEYELLFQQACNAGIEKISALEENKLVCNLFDAYYKNMLEKINGLTEKNIEISTNFGTKKIFEQIKEDLFYFDGAVNNILGCLASLLVKNGLSIFYKNLGDVGFSGELIFKEISSIENLIDQFHGKILLKSENSKSIFNKKETLLLRRKEINDIASRNKKEYIKTIEEIKRLMAIEFSIFAQYKDRNNVFQVIYS